MTAFLYKVQMQINYIYKVYQQIQDGQSNRQEQGLRKYAASLGCAAGCGN